MSKDYTTEHKYKVYQGKDGFWYTYLPGRKKVKRKSLTQIEEVLTDYYRKKEDVLTVEDVFREWNERRLALGKIKEATFTRNEQVFKRHYGKLKERRIKELASNDISDLLEEEISRCGLSSQGFSNLKSITKGFLKRAKKRGLIFWNVDAIISDVDVSEREFRKIPGEDNQEIFYDDEVEQIMNYCLEHAQDVNCLGVALMFATGLRVGEVVALQPNDISSGMVTVRKTETRFIRDGKYQFEVSDYPKTPAGNRTVIVPDKYLWILDALMRRDGDYIFKGRNGKRLHTQAIRKRLYQICKKQNIAVRSPHKARKTYGSILLDNGVDRKIIEKQMGHTDILTTETYYHRDRRSMDEKRRIINSAFSNG